jgi:hypothetical protein
MKLALLLTALLFAGCSAASAPAPVPAPVSASVPTSDWDPSISYECGMCEKAIDPGQSVRLRVDAAPTQHFRCINCALTTATNSAGAIEIATAAPESGTHITLRRSARGAWSTTPANAVFLSLPEADGECIDRHRVFPNTTEFDAWLSAHPALPADEATPFRIGELPTLLNAGLPEGK